MFTRRHAVLGLLAAAAGGHVRANLPARLELLPTGDVGVMLAARVTFGAEAALFVLDTGATTHLIDPQLGTRLALATESSAMVALPGGRTRVRQVTLPALRFGTDAALQFAPQRALEIDLAALREASGEDIRGLLGMPLWSQRPTTFDLARQELRFDEPAPAAGPDTFELPLRVDGGLPTIGASLGAGAGGRFLFDTGNAGAVVLFAHFAQTLARDLSLPEVTVQELGGAVTARYARSRRTTIGGFSRTDVPLALELGAAARRGGHFDRLAGSLGNALFDGGSVWLDVRGGRLVVQHPAAGSPIPGGFGLVPLAQAGGLVIGSVFDGGPAALAGLRPGDRIVSTDNVAAPDSAARFWRALRGRNEAALVLDRSGSPVRATLQRASFFPGLPP
ncbi:MAG TPA: aspartyl protease family protein [Rubrivivax sp.]